MTEEKWTNLVENLREKFEIAEEDEEPDTLTDDLGNEIKGTKQRVVFIAPQGKMLVTRTTRPAIIDKKSHYHKTQGGGALTEYVTSETETTSRLNVFTWDEIAGDWHEIDLKGDSISF